jgi:serine/threonine-protein kinase
MTEEFGAWRVVRRLGRGDLSEVVLAETAEGTPVAIKRLHGHVLDAPEVQALFAAEQTLTCGLAPHPHLVRGDGRGTVGKRPYLLMTYVDGDNARVRRERGETFSTPSAIATVLQVAQACEHLHGAGWIHGDLAPANLILDGSAAVTLCDLGVARRDGDSGPVRGTHAYMAPEQVRGEAWTPATDVFALGVVLWEFVTSDRLFHRGPSYLTMDAVVEGAVPPVAAPALSRVLHTALAKDPLQRYPSMSEFMAALSDAAARR